MNNFVIIYNDERKAGTVYLDDKQLRKWRTYAKKHDVKYMVAHTTTPDA